MRQACRSIIAIVVAAAAPSAHAVTAGFDDLAAQPAIDAVARLIDVNGGSGTYLGMVWDARFRVVGDQYRIEVGAPFYGVARSGRHFVTNEMSMVGGVPSDDGLTITTTQVLTEAWFGQNEYYGFGGGADQITIRALSGDTVLGAVTADLPDANPGLPEPLSKVDTSAFLALDGITGYRIDRRPQNEFASSWIADDFVFAAPVPEPGTWAMLVAGGMLLGWTGRLRSNRCA
jgi:hypothetical protein